MSKINSFVAKVKSVKNIEIILAIVLCVVIALVFLLSSTDLADGNADDFQHYVMSLESKVRDVVLSIDGVTNATIAISYDGGIMQEYAYEQSDTTKGDVTESNRDIILVQGKPVVIREVAPSILGVVIVLDGDINAVVNMYVSQAVTTLLGIDSSRVEIISYAN